LILHSSSFTCVMCICGRFGCEPNLPQTSTSDTHTHR